VAESSQGKEPDWWPRDPAGYIFLSRVVEKFGNALHKDWTGAEAIVIDPLPRSRKDASQTNLIDAERLLQHYRPDLKRPAVIGSNKFSEKHWKIAYGLARRLRPASERLRASQSELVRKNESGELDLKIRSRNGGPWRDFQTDWWGIQNWRSLIDRCCIDPDYPNGDRPSWREDNDHWIFATSQSVERSLDQLVGPDQKPTSDVVGPAARRPDGAVKGPRRGKIDRFGDADRALFPEIKRLMKSQHCTITEAVRRIPENKLAGCGTLDSRIRRVSDRFRNEKS
jgi:hypothetical protein